MLALCESLGLLSMKWDRLGILRVGMCILFLGLSCSGRFSFSLSGVFILLWWVFGDEARLPSINKALAVERDERLVLARTSKDDCIELALV